MKIYSLEKHLLRKTWFKAYNYTNTLVQNRLIKGRFPGNFNL